MPQLCKLYLRTAEARELACVAQTAILPNLFLNIGRGAAAKSRGHRAPRSDYVILLMGKELARQLSSSVEPC